MPTQNLIQTNHGVSFPLVGPNRMRQPELTKKDEQGCKPASDTMVLDKASGDERTEIQRQDNERKAGAAV